MAADGSFPGGAAADQALRLFDLQSRCDDGARRRALHQGRRSHALCAARRAQSRERSGVSHRSSQTKSKWPKKPDVMTGKLAGAAAVFAVSVRSRRAGRTGSRLATARSRPGGGRRSGAIFRSASRAVGESETQSIPHPTPIASMREARIAGLSLTGWEQAARLRNESAKPERIAEIHRAPIAGVSVHLQIVVVEHVVDVDVKRLVEREPLRSL